MSIAQREVYIKICSVSHYISYPAIMVGMRKNQGIKNQKLGQHTFFPLDVARSLTVGL